MISDKKQYEFITRQIGDLANATHNGLKLFLPIFSIIGGTIWLRTQASESPIPASYQFLSDALVILLAFVCIAITLTNLRAWWGYRMKLSEITAKSKHPVPKPVLVPSAVIEFILCLAMVTACGLFVIFNLFNSSN